MALMDREYVREAPRWHAGEAVGRAPQKDEQSSGLSKGQWLDRVATIAPLHEPATDAQRGAWYGVCVLIALVGIALFFWGALSGGAIPVWLTWTALGVGLFFGLAANGMKEDGQKRLDAQRHAQIMDGINRR